MKEYKNILLTAFRSSSSELLIKNTNRYATLFLPNDKIRDSTKLIDTLSEKNFDYVISFGQKPNIKNKVYIETTAKLGDERFTTNLRYDNLKDCFEKNCISCKISCNAGTSFCNRLYFNVLKYIFENNLETKIIFVHIPFMKNITDFDSFRKSIFRTIDDWLA